MSQSTLDPGNAIESDNDLLAAIIGSSLDGILVIETIYDDDGQIADFKCRLVNERAEQVLGYAKEDLIGEHLLEKFPQSKGEGLFEEYLRAIDTGEPYEGEVHYDYEHINGWFDVTIVPWKKGVVISFHEVTDHKETQQALQESKERFRLLAENASDVLIRTTAEGTIEYVSPASRPVLGFEPEELETRSGYDLIHPDDRDRARQLHDQVIETGSTEPIVYRHRHGDGGYVWVETKAQGIRDPDTGDVKQLVAVLRNVTDRRQNKRELEDAKDQAEAANRAKSQFLANMSHELRTPLNAVIGYSEMLQEDLEDEEAPGDQKEQFISDLEQIHTAGEQLLSLVNDVLDISKIEAGEMKLNPATFELPSMVGDTAETIRPLIEENGNQFTVDCPDDLGTIHTDQTKLRQALFNLLGNAAKFTQEGTVTLRVRRLSESDEGKDQVHFAVEDTGIGMTEEEQEKLFKAFAQADTSLTREHEGTGLGLVISQNLCQMMGGDIDLESEKGVGSTFTIRLPAEMKRRRGASEPWEETSPVDEQEGARPFEAAAAEDKEVVLVIDDDPRARDLIGRRLEKEGFVVAGASGGEEGLQRARELKPSVITLDVMMPHMDGWTVLSALQDDETLRNIPVVMVTIVEDEGMGYMLGATDYLTKPLDADRLASVLKKHTTDAACSILVVEDDEPTRELIRRTLEKKEHCMVREAENGRAGLELLEEHDVHPDVIILDLMMPKVDGFTFLEKLRRMGEDYNQTSVVVVTAKDLTSEDRKRLNGEVDNILQKADYDREDLLDEVQRCVAAFRTA